jgi:hypothetical protein
MLVSRGWRMSKHTPGPWEALTADQDGIVIVSGPFSVCTVNANEPQEAECLGNARLIAAAPELLAALERLLAWADQAVSPSSRLPYYAATCAVIAKAKGEAP